jgi:hypothetical protein
MLVKQTCRIAFALLLAVVPCEAQQTALTVDAVLTRVRENVAEFQKSIPGFACDESVLSQHLEGNKVKDEMSADSSFEMKPIGADGRLRESRHVKLVDGKVPKDPQKVSLPYTYSGGYADVIHFSESQCDDFHLQASTNVSTPIILVSSPKPASASQPTHCASLAHSIKATIDPQTFQVLRLETITQDITVDLGFRGHFIAFPTSRNNVLATSIDYAPVELGGKTYWLTKTVVNDFTDKTKPVHLHFEAHYSNYHRFAATSTIQPSQSIAPEPSTQP